MDLPSRAILDIELSEIGYGRYAMLAFNDQLGPVKEAVKLPADELLYTIRQIKSGSGDIEQVRYVGSHLFAGLGQAMRGYWDNYLSLAQSSGRLSLIRLKLSASELVQLPWEMMFDMQDRPLAEYVSVVRTPASSRPPRPVTASRYMHLLVATAAPSDYPAQDIEAALAPLRQALSQAQSSDFHGAIVQHITPDRLARQLGSEPVHLLHYIGHVSAGDLHRKGSAPEGLILESERQDSELLDIGRATALLQRSEIALLVLDAPTAVSPAIAGRFVDANSANAVVSFQFEITDRTAMAPFWIEFYQLLSTGQPVDEALFQARARLMSWPGLGSAAWGSPVLTMAGGDGRLFDLPGRPAIKGTQPAGLESLGIPSSATRGAGGEDLNNLIKQKESLEAAMSVYGGINSAPENLKQRWQTLQEQIDRLTNQ